MKLQLKKQAEPVAMPKWHPDFRSPEILPDLKVVRTSFFLNAICITAAAAAVLFTAFREYSAFSIKSDMKAAQLRIQETEVTNAKYLGLNREFLEASRKLNETKDFLAGSFRASETLVALSMSLPDAMDFTTISYDGNTMTLRGTIRGVSETASSRLSVYLDVLRNDPLLGPQFPEVSLTSLLRNPTTHGLSFEIQMSPSANGEPPANKA